METICLDGATFVFVSRRSMCTLHISGSAERAAWRAVTAGRRSRLLSSARFPPRKGKLAYRFPARKRHEARRGESKGGGGKVPCPPACLSLARFFKGCGAKPVSGGARTGSTAGVPGQSNPAETVPDDPNNAWRPMQNKQNEQLAQTSPREG